MRWDFRWRGLPFAVLVAVSGLAMVLGAGRVGWSMETDWSGTARVLVSDNINRRSPGLEARGELFRYRLNFEMEEQARVNEFILTGFGGWERKITRDGEDSRELIYGIRGNFQWDLRRGHYIRFGAGGSRETDTLDSVNLDRTRQLTNRLDAAVAVGRESASEISWETSVSGERLQREFEDSRIARLDALVRVPVNVRTSVHSEVSGFMGDEIISGDEWTGADVNLGISSVRSPKTTRGADIFWVANSTDFSGTVVTSDWQNMGLSGNQDGRLSERTSYRAELGLESLNPWDSSRDFEPLVSMELSTLLHRDVSLNLFAFNRNTVSLNNRRQPVWSRRTSAGADFNWNAARNLSLTAALARWRDDFPPGQATTSRIDDETVGSMGLRWNVTRHVDSEIAYVSDQVNSSIPERDFQENRIEISVTGRL